MPQLRAPPRWSLKITGPSTMNAAKQKFEIAKPRIGSADSVTPRPVSPRPGARSAASGPASGIVAIDEVVCPRDHLPFLIYECAEYVRRPPLPERPYLL